MATDEGRADLMRAIAEGKQWLAERSPARKLSRQLGTSDPSVDAGTSFLSGATSPFVSFANLLIDNPLTRIGERGKTPFDTSALKKEPYKIPYLPHASGTPYIAGQLLGYALPGAKAEKLAAAAGEGLTEGIPALAKVPKFLRLAAKGASTWGPLGALTATPAQGRKESAEWGALGGGVGEPVAPLVGKALKGAGRYARKGAKWISEKTKGIGNWVNTRKGAENAFKDIPHPEAANRDLIQDQLNTLNEETNKNARKYHAAFESLGGKKMEAKDILNSINRIAEDSPKVNPDQHLTPLQKFKIFKMLPLPKGSVKMADDRMAEERIDGVVIKDIAKDLREAINNKVVKGPIDPRKWYDAAKAVYTSSAKGAKSYQKIYRTMMNDLEDVFSKHGDLKKFRDARQHWKDYVMPIRHSPELERSFENQEFLRKSNLDEPGNPSNYYPNLFQYTDPETNLTDWRDITPYDLADKFIPTSKDVSLTKYNNMLKMWRGKPESFVKNQVKNLMLSRYKTGRGNIDVEKLLKYVNGLSNSWRKTLFTKEELNTVNRAYDRWKAGSTSPYNREQLQKLLSAMFLGGLHPGLGHLIGWELPTVAKAAAKAGGKAAVKTGKALVKFEKKTQLGKKLAETKRGAPLLSAEVSKKFGQLAEEGKNGTNGGNGGSNGTHSK